MSEYTKFIKDCVGALCIEFNKSYPKVFEKFYDDYGFPTEKGCSFEIRMEMALYIELIKAGIINSENHDEIMSFGKKDNNFI